MSDTTAAENALVEAIETLAKKAASTGSLTGSENIGAAAHHLAEAYSWLTNTSNRNS
jgi:hypothetical protein